MKLFINAGVAARTWNEIIKIEELPNSGCKLIIPNYVKSEKRTEYITLTIPNVKKDDFEKDVTLNEIALGDASGKIINFKHFKTKNSNYMYALLRSKEIVSDDIFIPISMKDKITVIKRIRFWDCEADYGDFLSNVYLVKIKLDIGESIPFYLVDEEPRYLKAHYVFYRSSWERKCSVTKKLKTYILLNEENKNDFISLSKI